MQDRKKTESIIQKLNELNQNTEFNEELVSLHQERDRLRKEVSIQNKN